MKTHLIVAISLAILLASGCSHREAEARRAKEEAQARARAEAARKEMEALPKTFRTPDYFRRNEPAKNTDATSDPKKATP